MLWSKAVRSDLQAHKSYRRELVNHRSTGSEFWRNGTSRASATTPTQPITGCVIRDMTEKHRYERALKESEQRARKGFAELETLYDTAPIGPAMFSQDLRFVG